MPGSIWRRWTWLEAWPLYLAGALMRVAWIWPLAQVALSHAYVAPRGVTYPAWLILAVYAATAALGKALGDRRATPYVAAGLGVLASVVAGVALYGSRFGGGWRAWLLAWPLAAINWSEGVPGLLLAMFITALLWRDGLQADWASRRDLWRGFSLGTLGMAALLLMRPATWQAAGVRPLGLALVFVLSGLTALALQALRQAARTRPSDDDASPGLTRHWAMVIGGVVLGVLALGWALGLVLSPETVSEIWQALGPAVGLIGRLLRLLLIGFAYVFMWLLGPLVNWLRGQMGEQEQEPFVIERDLADQWREQQEVVVGLPEGLRIALIVGAAAVALALAVWLFVHAWRRRTQGDRLSEGVLEQRSSVLSASLLSDQLRDLLRRLRPGVTSPYLPLPAGNAPRERIRRLYQRLLDAVGRVWPRRPHVTPGAYAQELRIAAPTEIEALETLTAAYELARYGQDPPTPAQAEQAEAAWARLAPALERWARPLRDATNRDT
jgi:hypothetical protein